MPSMQACTYNYNHMWVYNYYNKKLDLKSTWYYTDMDVFLQILDVLLDTGREEERRELSKKKKGIGSVNA